MLNPGAARDDSIDVTLMIEPPSGMPGRQARMKLVTLVKFSSTRAAWPLAEMSVKGALKPPPALLTRMSIGPRVATRASTASRRRTSRTSVLTVRPRAAAARAVTSSPSASRSHSARSAPKAARARAVAAPIPTAAPVTSATRPASDTSAGEAGMRGQYSDGPSARRGGWPVRADLEWGSIPGLVVGAAQRFGDAEALVDGSLRVGFAGLAEMATAATRSAIGSGLAPGDRAAIWAPNIHEWIAAALGVLGAGGVLVPLNTRFKGGEAAYVLGKARARMLFTVTDFLD